MTKSNKKRYPLRTDEGKGRLNSYDAHAARGMTAEIYYWLEKFALCSWYNPPLLPLLPPTHLTYLHLLP